MNKYIDVDKFAEAICNFRQIDEDAANAMIWLLRTFPTADVVEVVHAHWIEHPHFNFEGGYSGANYECSNCHYDDLYDLDDANYCPKCGAKMDGERRGE